MIDKPDKVEARSHILLRIVAHWGASQRPPLAGIMWMAVLLGILLWLADQHEGIFLVRPFAATMSILLYLPGVSIAQPFAIVYGSVFGAAIGTVLSMFLGVGPGVAIICSAHRADRAALAACVSFPRHRFGDVSCAVASRAMVCSSGRTAIYARCGDFLRSDVPVAEQLAAIPRAASNRERRNLSRKLALLSL